MAIGGKNLKVLTKVLFYGPGFGRGFDDYEVFAHPDASRLAVPGD
jgi:hypothetical protein